MAAEESIQLTPQEFRELLIMVRQNQATLSNLDERMSDMHRIVAGNGQFDKSLVGRLQLLEERQRVGDEKSAKQQHEICADLNDLKKSVQRHNALLEKDHVRLDGVEKRQDDLDEAQEETEEKQDALEKTVAAARNKAIGIGIGLGVGTGISLFGITEIAARILEGLP